MKNKLTILLLSSFVLLNSTVKSQNIAQSLLNRTVERLEKDGGITMSLLVVVRNVMGTDTRDVTFDMHGNSFRSIDDENTLWFDGKTFWRGNDFGNGIEEIYISEPMPDEAAKYNLVEMLKTHEGFNVEGNGQDSFTLKASGTGGGMAGINIITVNIDPATYRIRSANVIFAEETGDIRASITVKGYTPGRTFDKKTFVCPVKDYKDADIIDLR
ncbi:MAG: hypothetical protein IKS24_09925 [Bacteroidaceae bacterium]|nr:hypothetical protein [Bacteroidaceae bacterium]